MAIDIAVLRGAIDAVGNRLESEHSRLTDLDGKLGDGDLGVTLLKAFRALSEGKDKLPADIGLALLSCGGAVAKVSSSSFGTLMATALIAVSRTTKGRETAPWTELPSWLDLAIAAMMARGKASLGDKTVLDALDAVARAVRTERDPAAMLVAARAAVAATLAEFGSRPNRIGRARVYGERSIGLDDPGMVALAVMLDGLDDNRPG